MKNVLLMCLSVAVVGTLAPKAVAGDDCGGCEKIKAEGQGFCDQCSKGMIYGVSVKSQKIFKVLEGASIDKGVMSTMKCDGCKTAMLKSGVCSQCKVGVAEGRIYQSIPAHTLAKGKVVSAAKMTCTSCKERVADGGFCSSCQAGFVGGRVYKGEEQYQQAKAAHAVIAKAAGAKCEQCAVAMLTDGECEQCQAKFKDGKKS